MKYQILLEAVTPIAHQDTGTAGKGTNVRLFMRQNMMVNGIPARVPALSENALRSVLFREPLADDLIKTLGIADGSLPQAVVNLLFSGGNMAAGSKAPANEIELGHQVKKAYPSIDLLGGAVDGFILPRSRLKVSAWLLAKEYVPALKLIAPELADEAKTSAFDLIAEETRTRGTGGESGGNKMIYTYETMAAGTRVLVELSLDAHASEVCASALAHALECWNGFVGGQGRQGRGRMVVVSHNLPSAETYRRFVADNTETMKAGLENGTLGTEKKLCA